MHRSGITPKLEGTMTTAILTRDSLQDLLGRTVGAWNRHDLPGLCQEYQSQAHHISDAGQTYGREKILELYKRKFSNSFSMGFLTYEFRHAGMTDDMAFAIIRWGILSNDGKI